MSRRLTVSKDHEEIWHVKYFDSFIVTFICNAFMFQAVFLKHAKSSVCVHVGTTCIITGFLSHIIDKYLSIDVQILNVITVLFTE